MLNRSDEVILASGEALNIGDVLEAVYLLARDKGLFPALSGQDLILNAVAVSLEAIQAHHDTST